MAWAKFAGASGSPVTTASQKDTKTISVMPSELLEGARPVAISQRLPPWWVSSGSLVVNTFASMAEVEGLGQGTDTLLNLWTYHTYASCQGHLLLSNGILPCAFNKCAGFPTGFKKKGMGVGEVLSQ